MFNLFFKKKKIRLACLSQMMVLKNRFHVFFVWLCALMFISDVLMGFQIRIFSICR